MRGTKENFLFGAIRGGSILWAIAFAVVAQSHELAKQDLSKAEELYKSTRYEQSLAAIDKHQTDPATQFLLGRDYFMLGELKKATECFQHATAGAPQNSAQDVCSPMCADSSAQRHPSCAKMMTHPFRWYHAVASRA